MPMIIVQANKSEVDAVRVTLSELIITIHRQDERRAAQLIEPTACSAIDTERLESSTDGADRRRRPRPIQPSRDVLSSGPAAGTLPQDR